MTIYKCIFRIALGHQQLDASKRRRTLNTYDTVFGRHFQMEHRTNVD